MKMTDIYEIAEYTLKALKNCGADAAQCIVGRSKKDELNVDLSLIHISEPTRP